MIIHHLHTDQPTSLADHALAFEGPGVSASLETILLTQDQQQQSREQRVIALLTGAALMEGRYPAKVDLIGQTDVTGIVFPSLLQEGKFDLVDLCERTAWIRGYLASLAGVEADTTTIVVRDRPLWVQGS